MYLLRSRLASLLLVGLVALSSMAAAVPALAQETATETHGVQLADMDLAADPDANFYRFANGGWLDRTEIPADLPSFGVFEELDEITQEQLLGLLDELSGGSDLEEGTDEWKAVQLFTQATDLEARNANGVSPVQPILDEIDAIQDLEGLHQFLVDSEFKGVTGLFSFEVYSDLEDSTVWSAYLFGPEFWLPNRDYYLEDDEANEATRAAYVEALAAMLAYAGYDEAQGLAAGQAVYDFEKRLVEPTLTQEEQQDFSLMNVRMTIPELQETYPLMDWAAFMAARDLGGVEQVIAGESRYLTALAPIIEETPLDAIKDALKLQLLWTNRAYLGEDIQSTSFDFRGRVLSGTQEEPPIEERALDTVNQLLGEALGKIYVEEYFPPEAKVQIEELIAQVTEAFSDRLARNQWMSPEAKAEAQDKLSKIIVKAGYPDTWRSYDEVAIEGSYAETVQSATNAEYRRFLARVGQPVDKTEWFIPPQVVNAFYDPSENSISFPAAILQPPFFDYLADPASNFGAIGMIIGHEITHGYDLQGSQFDADGNLQSWGQRRTPPTSRRSTTASSSSSARSRSCPTSSSTAS